MLQTAPADCAIGRQSRLRAGVFAQILTLPMVRMGERKSPPRVATSADPAAAAPGGGGTIAPLDSDDLHQVSGRTGLGIMLALTTVVLWAMLPIALKIVLGGMDALTLTWYRFLAAAIVLGGFLAARGTVHDFRALRRPTWLLLAVAVVCLSANYALYVLGLDRTNASTAQVVIQIAPVLLAVGGVWVFKERFGWLQRLGLAVMVGGLIVFSRDQIANLLADLSSFYNGVLMIVAAAVAWAAYGLAQKQLLNSMSSPSVMLCVYVGGAVIFAPLAKPAGVTELTPAQLGALVFCIANMLIAYGTFAESLGHLEASRVSAVLAIVPLCTLAIIRLVENVMPSLMAPEPTSWVGLAGACMVVGGALMISVTRGRAA